MPLFRIYSEFRIFQFSIKSLQIFLHFDQKSVFLYKLGITKVTNFVLKEILVDFSNLN